MSKAIADRIDVGQIAMRLRPIDEPIVDEFVASGLPRPNYIISFYKVRRGKYAGTKLWCHADLGTCRVKGLFLTTSSNEPIPIDKTTIHVVKNKERELEERDRKSGANRFKKSAF